MQRYSGFGKWAKVLRTFARSCGDRGGNLRHIGDEAAKSCRKAVTLFLCFVFLGYNAGSIVADNETEAVFHLIDMII